MIKDSGTVKGAFTDNSLTPGKCNWARDDRSGAEGISYSVS